MKTRPTEPKHEAVFQELCAVLKKHADQHDLSAVELLAIASTMVGMLIANQDQRQITASMAMDVVAANIEAGNKRVRDELAAATAGSA